VLGDEMARQREIEKIDAHGRGRRRRLSR